MPRPPLTAVWDHNFFRDMLVIEQVWFAPGDKHIHYKRGDGPAVITTISDFGGFTRMRWIAKNNPTLEVTTDDLGAPLLRTWSGKEGNNAETTTYR